MGNSSSSRRRHPQDRQYQEPQEYETPPPSEQTLNKWDQITRYQLALQAKIKAGEIDPAKAEWGDRSTSMADLTGMIQRHGIPWTGPLPSEPGLTTGKLSTSGPRPAAARTPYPFASGPVGATAAPASQSAGFSNPVQQAIQGATLGMVPTNALTRHLASAAPSPSASAASSAPIAQSVAPLDPDQISAVQQAARFSSQSPLAIATQAPAPAAGQAPPSVAAMASLTGRDGPATRAQLSQEAQAAVNAAGRRGVPANFGDPLQDVRQGCPGSRASQSVAGPRGRNRFLQRAASGRRHDHCADSPTIRRWGELCPDDERRRAQLHGRGEGQVHRSRRTGAHRAGGKPYGLAGCGQLAHPRPPTTRRGGPEADHPPINTPRLDRPVPGPTQISWPTSSRG
jgi:hypothetical protein